jgi:hypothetical protein
MSSNHPTRDHLPELAGLSPAQRIATAQEAAERLGRLVAAIDAGELDADPVERAYIVGVRAALEAVAA